MFPAYLRSYAPDSTLCEVAKLIVDDMYPSLDKCSAFSSNNVSSLVFYIVLDELGALPSLARSIINDKSMLIADLRYLLSKRGFVGIDKCIFEFALVGTGIVLPSAKGSLHYDRVTFSVDGGSVFNSRLAESNPDLPCGEILAHLEAIPGVCELLANQRCAALLADAVQDIVRTLGPLSPNDVAGFDFEGFLLRHAAHLERVAVSQYISSSGWGALWKEVREVYASWLLSAVATQPLGYHLLPPSVLEYLVTHLGAVSDTLALTGNASAPGPIKGSAGRYSSSQARLSIPAFSVIIATHILRDGFEGNAGGANPSECHDDDANTGVILGVMNAHLWSAAFHEKDSFEFDFQTFAPCVCKHAALLTAPAFGQQGLGREVFDEWCAQNKMKTINDHDRVGGRN